MRSSSIRLILLAGLAAMAPACSRGANATPGEESPPARPLTGCTVDGDTALNTSESGAPSLAAGGGHFAVAWTDTSGAHLRLVEHDGKTVREQPLGAGGKVVGASVAALVGGGFAVAWEEMSGTSGAIHAQRFDDGGLPVGGPVLLGTTASAEAHPTVAASTDGALITWTDADGASVAELKRERVASHLTITGAAQAASSGGTDHVGLVWTQGAQIGFAEAKIPLTSAGRATLLREGAGGTANVPRIASGPDGRYAVVWEDPRAGVGAEAVYLNTVTGAGKVGKETMISPAGTSADFPDVIWVGDRVAVAYYQFRDGPPGVFVTLADPDTGPLGREVAIDAHHGARFPRLAWGGKDTLGLAYVVRGGPVHLATLRCE